MPDGKGAYRVRKGNGDVWLVDFPDGTPFIAEATWAQAEQMRTRLNHAHAYALGRAEGVGLLKRIEWSSAMSGDGRKVACPCCAGMASHGHAPDCELAKAIAEGGAALVPANAVKCPTCGAETDRTDITPRAGPGGLPAYDVRWTCINGHEWGEPGITPVRPKS